MAFLGHDRIIAEKQALFDTTGELLNLSLSDLFDDKFVKQTSYDLRLGEEFYVVGKRAPERLSEKQPYISLPPGQFAVLTCYEILNLRENIMAFITLRNRFKMQGLVNVSGFHVDPTFKGRLVFAVQNIGPNDIRLRYKDPTFTIFFADVEGNKTSVREAPIRSGILLSDVQQLGASSITLAKLKKDIDSLRTVLLVYAPFAVALVVALLITLIKLGGAAPPK
jgi:dCTP deaminase